MCLDTHDEVCKKHGKIVILSNVQLKSYYKHINVEYMEMLKNRETEPARKIHEFLLLPGKNNSYKHIKIIKSEQIDNSEPLLEEFEKQEREKAPSDWKIEDSQTEKSFIKGIGKCKSFHADDLVSYITYIHNPSDNPSQGYQEFETECKDKLKHLECCSLHTKHDCEFLQKVNKQRKKKEE
jgi:hypothetical protein